MKFLPFVCSTLILGPVLTAAITVKAAEPVVDLKEEARRKECQLLEVLKSDAPKGEKGIACKMLAVYGSDQAVPELAKLLTDPELSSWARIGLEAIPGPVADKALRDGMEQTQGRILVGVINSIGVRADAAATSALIDRLKDQDDQVAIASAVALGRIGGDRAARALRRAVGQASPARAAEFAEGAIRCAEGFMAAKKNAAAANLYESVLESDVPKHKKLEATRGLILARGDSGIPLLLEQLTSADPGEVGVGLRTARELPGRKATMTLATKLRGFTPERQPLVLLALADRNDSAALPTIVEAGRSGSLDLRLTAVNILERQGDISSIPTLLESSVDKNGSLAQAAQASLVRLPGDSVDADLLGRLQAASGKSREVLIRVAGLRQIQSAIPTMVSSLQSTDASIRTAAVQAIGLLGGVSELPLLVAHMQKTSAAKEQDDIETALISISGRSGPGAVAALQPLAQSGQENVRIAALHALAAAGGPDALKALYAASSSAEEGIRDEAVRTLATWPNTWPEDTGVVEPLLTLARSGAKPAHQVLALRAYLQYVQGNRQIKEADKIQAIREIIPLVKRPDEKRMAISVVDELANPAVLDLLIDFTADPAVTEDACSALVKLCGRKRSGLDAPLRKKGLEVAIEKSSNEDLKKRARERLAEL